MKKAYEINKLLIEKFLIYLVIGLAGYFYAWAVGL